MICHFPNFGPSLSPFAGAHIENWHRTRESRWCILHGMLVVDSSRLAVEMMKIDEKGLKKPSTILCPYLSSKMGARIGQPGTRIGMEYVGV
jgi:hypothetical protein